MSKPRQHSGSEQNGSGSRGSNRRSETVGVRATAQPHRRASLAKRLTAELETLKKELAAARAEIQVLQAQADVDGLLNILNRRGFERELARSLAYAKRYRTTAALIFLDLDGFKGVNDRHGHGAGDAVLRHVASTLAGSVRASDVLGRMGGDEFAVILWNVSPEAAAAKTATLEQVVATTAADWNGVLLSVSASAGWTMLSADDDIAFVVARADRAMYARKTARDITR